MDFINSVGSLSKAVSGNCRIELRIRRQNKLTVNKEKECQ
jgi:hypothetical protein